jgi:hypothetical protein
MLGCVGQSPRGAARSSRRATFWLLGLLGVMTGCASGLPLVSPPPSVKPGDFIELFTEGPLAYRVAVDPRGMAHVFGVTRTNELQHVVLNPQGVISRESVRQVEGRGAFDVAIDAAGTIHLLVGNDYMWLSPTGWNTAERGHCEVLVAIGSTLLCIFRIEGSEAGAPFRFELFVVGGCAPGPACGAVPVPWISRGTKLGIARRAADAWMPLAVAEPESKNDVSYWKVFGTDDGVVRLLYIARFPTLVIRGAQLRYATFPVAGGQGQEVLKVVGSEVPDGYCGGESVSMAAEGGRVLMIEGASSSEYTTSSSGCNYARHVENGKVTRTYGFLRHGRWHRLRLASAGGGRAHALIRRNTLRQVKSEEGRVNNVPEAAVDYLWYSGEGWSSPVELAPPGRYNDDRGYDIASARDGPAIAIIPFRDGRLMARWIEVRP